MTDPVLVEVVRGTLVESRHRGAVAVVDADGAGVLTLGDAEAPVYPRSAIKALQALPLILSGAADRFGFGDEELALACASHGGEPAHVVGVARMLSAAGLDDTALQCGVHWPRHQPAAHDLVRAGRTAGPLHHNCSGKHAGMLCAACALGAPVADYISPGHPVQREILAALEAAGGAAIPDAHRGTDGCSVPTWAMPLKNLARAFARLGTGQGLAPGTAAAFVRLRTACANKPWFVDGSGRFVTRMMETFGPRLFIKIGAEGVMCAALPGEGLGFAIKCEDGGRRGAEAIAAALIARLLPMADDERAQVDRHARAPLKNWRGVVVGEVRGREFG
jgi:L-asparaginase II